MFVLAFALASRTISITLANFDRCTTDLSTIKATFFLGSFGVFAGSVMSRPIPRHPQSFSTPMKSTNLNHIPTTGVSHNPSIRKQVMLHTHDLKNLTNFAQARFAPGDVAAAHSHADMSEVFFVESGFGKICVDGVDVALEPGVCVAIGPHEVHEVSNTGETDLVLTYFGIRA